MNNNKEYAIVTGASSGIGEAIAKYLTSKKVIVFGLDIQEGKEKGIRFLKCDVSKENEVTNSLALIEKETNQIKYLVNVVGILSVGGVSYIKDQNITYWNTILNINLTSILIMIKNVLPFLIRSHEASVVNISSDQSFKGLKGAAPYSVSKAGVNALTKIAALELSEFGIRVNAVAPGTVKTNFLQSVINDTDKITSMYRNADKKLPFGLIEPNDVAALVDFLLSNRSKRITGEVILIDSGQILNSISL